MKTFDIAVVGSSIAGLLTAKLLREHGADVIVLEREHALVHAPRTLIVTAGVEGFLAGIDRSYVRNRIARFELHAAMISSVVSLAKPDLVIERRALIQALAGSAAERGVEIALGHSVASVRPRDGGWQIQGGLKPSRDAFEVRCRNLVAADGATSAVASSVGRPRPPLASLVQAIVEMPHDWAADTGQVWFAGSVKPFFLWSIPEGHGTTAIGVISTHAADARTMLDDHLRAVGLKPLGYQAAKVPLYQSWIPLRRRIEGSDVYFVGDAAGHVKVTTVGGVGPGLLGAEAVTQRLTSGLRTKEVRLRMELNLQRGIRRAIEHLSDRELEELVGSVGARRGRSHDASSRDNAMLLVLRAVLARPQVFPVAMRGVLRALSPRSGRSDPQPSTFE